MANSAWMVRTGKNGYMAQTCWEKGVIAYGWKIPNVTSVRSLDELQLIIRSAHPDESSSRAFAWAGQYHLFVNRMQAGDWIITYQGDRRIYFLGKITGPCEFDEHCTGDLEHFRRVDWQFKVDRDILSTRSKAELGNMSSVFPVPGDVVKELVSRGGVQPEYQPQRAAIEVSEPSPIIEVRQTNDQIREDLEGRAFEFVKDMIIRLDWREMQQLVAGILRAMGFKTRVSPEGADRGCDVLASPDGLGLSQPRILVEVKHRRDLQIDAPMIRSFLGGRRPGDNGMYVSTGGFTKDAKYEGDRATIPLKLIDLDDLAELLIERYSKLDVETRALVPLIPIYWPATLIRNSER